MKSFAKLLELKGCIVSISITVTTKKLKKEELIWDHGFYPWPSGPIAKTCGEVEHYGNGIGSVREH